MRLSALVRLAAGSGLAVPWAAGAAALLLAGERFGAGREPPAGPLARAGVLLGTDALAAATLAELRRRLPARARWVLAEVTDDDSLWRAEGRWWSRVEADGFALLAPPGFGPAPVLGVAAMLAADAWGCGRRWSWRPAAAAGWRCSMRWRERLRPVRMQRVAVVAPVAALRDVLVGHRRPPAHRLLLQHPSQGIESEAGSDTARGE